VGGKWWINNRTLYRHRKQNIKLFSFSRHIILDIELIENDEHIIDEGIFGWTKNDNIEGRNGPKGRGV